MRIKVSVFLMTQISSVLHSSHIIPINDQSRLFANSSCIGFMKFLSNTYIKWKLNSQNKLYLLVVILLWNLHKTPVLFFNIEPLKIIFGWNNSCYLEILALYLLSIKLNQILYCSSLNAAWNWKNWRNIKFDHSSWEDIVLVIITFL